MNSKLARINEIFLQALEKKAGPDREKYLTEAGLKKTVPPPAIDFVMKRVSD